MTNSGENLRQQYWQRIAGMHRHGAWLVLDDGYADPSRAYHTWEHIDHMLDGLERFSTLAKRPDLIATAIFWHDAAYRTQKPDGSYRPDAANVDESAALFRRFTLLPEHEADAVYAMIMATKEHRKAKAAKNYYDGFAGDFDLFIDLDLSILGAQWDVFARYDTNIRKEFAWVSDDVFYRRRADVLRDFVPHGERLFRREQTNFAWGERAQVNLERVIANLEKKAAPAPVPV